MSAADDQLREANWSRVREALARAARDYRRAADELEAIPFDNAKGIRRTPDAIISQAALTGNVGREYAELMHRLATWSESINELERHAAAASQICGYRITDPYRVCILAPGHDLPKDDGLLVHVSEDGVTFA